MLGYPGVGVGAIRGRRGGTRSAGGGLGAGLVGAVEQEKGVETSIALGTDLLRKVDCKFKLL